jgi:prepilin-type N-terminal cleavage/methylation domain-containing protein
MTRAPGFTLLEVLVALLVLSIALLGFVGTLAPAVRLSGEGRLRARAAEVMASRLDELRAELARSGPGCNPPAGGSAGDPAGLRESWSATAGAGYVTVAIVVAADTLHTALPCP